MIAHTLTDRVAFIVRAVLVALAAATIFGITRPGSHGKPSMADQWVLMLATVMHAGER